MGGDTAEPPESGEVPKLVPSAENWTLPVGVPAPGAVAVTVAVNVTGSPNTVGDSAETTVVVVPAWLTTWPVDPWLALKSLVPQLGWRLSMLPGQHPGPKLSGLHVKMNPGAKVA